jgi:hypothetical protein
LRTSNVKIKYVPQFMTVQKQSQKNGDWKEHEFRALCAFQIDWTLCIMGVFLIWTLIFVQKKIICCRSLLCLHLHMEKNR